MGKISSTMQIAWRYPSSVFPPPQKNPTNSMTNKQIKKKQILGWRKQQDKLHRNVYYAANFFGNYSPGVHATPVTVTKVRRETRREPWKGEKRDKNLEFHEIKKAIILLRIFYKSIATDIVLASKNGSQPHSQRLNIYLWYKGLVAYDWSRKPRPKSRDTMPENRNSWNARVSCLAFLTDWLARESPHS